MAVPAVIDSGMAVSAVNRQSKIPYTDEPRLSGNGLFWRDSRKIVSNTRKRQIALLGGWGRA